MPMENEGPRPPLKGQCRETAAEQMSRQQKEYEDRSGPPRDEVKQAATHNETHPKLKQQLDKRRSAIEFMDQPSQRVCLCHVEDRGGESSNYRRRSDRRKPDRTRRPRNTNRVTKRRDRKECTCSRCIKKPIYRKNIAYLRIYVTDKRIGTDSMLLDEDLPDVPNPRGSIQGSNHSAGISEKPSSYRSVSSYHSFDSSEHQPVV